MKKIAFAVALIVGSIAAVQAAESGPYAGVAVGNTYGKGASGDFDGFSKSHSGTFFKAFGGYQINKYIAAEIAYNDLGTYKYSLFADANNNVTAFYEVKSYTAAAVGSLPLGDFAINAKLGLAVNTAQNDFGGRAAGVAFNASEKKTKTGALVGFGGSYSLNKNVDFRLEYENFGKAGSEDTGRMKSLSAWSLGIVGRF